MRDFFAVTRREIVERRGFLILAAILGVLPLLLPWLPSVQRHSPAEARTGAAILLGALTAMVAAVGLGATVWAGDMAGGRLGFYLGRPIRSWALWGGKLIALLVLLPAMVALTTLPGLLAGEGAGRGVSGLLPLWLFDLDVGVLLVVGVVALALAAHMARTLVSRRSPLLLGDLLLLAIAASLLATAARRLFDAPAEGDLLRGAGAVLTLCCATALGAIAAETAIGRTDLSRGRRAASVALWTGLGLAAAGGSLFTAWTLSADLDDLDAAWPLQASPDGRWLYLAGPASRRVDYTPGFMLDLQRRKARRLGGVSLGLDRQFLGDLFFSANGERAVWKHLGRLSHSAWLVDLNGDRPLGELGDTGYETTLALSPSGRLMASATRRRIEVVDLDSPGGRLVAVERLPRTVGYSWLRFVGEDRLRIVSFDVDDRAQIGVWDLDLRSRELEEGCQLAALWMGSLSLQGDRLVARSAEGRERVLLALPDCRRLATFPPGKLDWPFDVRFLPSGRLLRVVERAASHELQIHDADGLLQAQHDLGHGIPEVGGMPAPNQIVVSSSSDDEPWLATILDLTTGERRPLGPGLVPVADPTTAIGSPATRVFATADGLVELDFESGRRTAITHVPALQR